MVVAVVVGSVGTISLTSPRSHVTGEPIAATTPPSNPDTNQALHFQLVHSEPVENPLPFPCTLSPPSQRSMVARDEGTRTLAVVSPFATT